MEVTPATLHRLWAAPGRGHLARKRLLNGCGSNEWMLSAACIVGNAPNHSKYQTVKPHCKSPTLTLKSLKIKHSQDEATCGSWRKKLQIVTISFSLQWGSSESLEAPTKYIIFFISVSLLHGPDLWKDGLCKIPGAFTLLQAEIVKDGQQSICSVYKTVRALAHSISVLSGLSTIGHVRLDLRRIFLVVPPPTTK